MRTLLAAVALVGGIAAAPAARAQAGTGAGTGEAPAAAARREAPAGAKKNVVIHLTQFRDNPHAATMALDLARAMQRRGATVTLFLDVDGVGLADSSARIAARGEKIPGPSLGSLWNEFIGDGGRVFVCAHCAEAAKISEDSLRKGATLAPADQAARIFLRADQVIDY